MSKTSDGVPCVTNTHHHYHHHYRHTKSVKRQVQSLFQNYSST